MNRGECALKEKGLIKLRDSFGRLSLQVRTEGNTHPEIEAAKIPDTCSDSVISLVRVERGKRLGLVTVSIGLVWDSKSWRIVGGHEMYFQPVRSRQSVVELV